MSASEIGGSVSQSTPPPPTQQNSQAVEARVVRAEEVQRKMEENSPRTKPPQPSGGSEPYKGDAIDVYA